MRPLQSALVAMAGQGLQGLAPFRTAGRDRMPHQHSEKELSSKRAYEAMTPVRTSHNLPDRGQAKEAREPRAPGSRPPGNLADPGSHAEGAKLHPTPTGGWA